MLFFYAITVLSIILDQATKLLAVSHLQPVGSVEILPEILNLTYVENRGAAFGMMADSRWIFMTVSTVAILGLLAYAVVKKPKSLVERLSLALIVGGGIGNMIDRIRLGYVIDFIDAVFVDFYVFNVADSCVCVGCGLLILHLILSEVRDRRDNGSRQS